MVAKFGRSIQERALVEVAVPSLECSGIPFGITAGGLTLNSLSLFTDHPLLRVSLITSRLLPRVIQDHDEDDDDDEEEDGATVPAGPPDT